MWHSLGWVAVNSPDNPERIRLYERIDIGNTGDGSVTKSSKQEKQMQEFQLTKLAWVEPSPAPSRTMEAQISAPVAA